MLNDLKNYKQSWSQQRGDILNFLLKINENEEL